MADSNSYGNGTSETNGLDSFEATLGRLSKKAGVRAAVVLDRATGVVLRTTGQISAIRTTQSSASFASETANDSQGAEEVAAMVWSFVSAAGTLVQDLDAEDELKLLRLRTKKQELVIVPNAKYLLIVVHDTPAA